MSRFVRARLVELCAEKLNWKKIHNIHHAQKKYVKKDMQKIKTALFRQQLKKSEVQEFESRHVIDEAFSGSLPIF